MIMIVIGLEFCCHCSYLASYAVLVFILHVLYTLSSATLFTVMLCKRMTIIIFESCILKCIDFAYVYV